jgi:hypothetical protein
MRKEYTVRTFFEQNPLENNSIDELTSLFSFLSSIQFLLFFFAQVFPCSMKIEVQEHF